MASLSPYICYDARVVLYAGVVWQAAARLFGECEVKLRYEARDTQCNHKNTHAGSSGDRGSSVDLGPGPFWGQSHICVNA